MNNTGPSPQIQVLHHTFHTALNFLFLPFACINLQATHPLCLASPPPNLWYVDKPFKEIASPFVRLNANKHMSRLDKKTKQKLTRIDKENSTGTKVLVRSYYEKQIQVTTCYISGKQATDIWNAVYFFFMIGMNLFCLSTDCSDTTSLVLPVKLS